MPKGHLLKCINCALEIKIVYLLYFEIEKKYLLNFTLSNMDGLTIIKIVNSKNILFYQSLHLLFFN